MATIEVSNEVDDDLALLAKAWQTTKGEVVRRLLTEYVGAPAASSARANGTSIDIHAVYEGRRTEARFDPSTRRVDITSGPLAGHSYKSPSGAAIAVVSSQNSSVHPNRNGWSFWTVSETGELLQTLRR